MSIGSRFTTCGFHRTATAGSKPSLRYSPGAPDAVQSVPAHIPRSVTAHSGQSNHSLPAESRASAAFPDNPPNIAGRIERNRSTNARMISESLIQHLLVVSLIAYP